MTDREVRFAVPAGIYSEALDIAAEMGLELADLASSAFSAYVEGVRDARLNDVDNVASSEVVAMPLPGEGSRPLEGTEEWLGTEDPERM